MTVTLILGLPLVAQAVSVSVTELLADPDRFNGQPVMVGGTISGYREGATFRGSRYYTFDLSDGIETVPVIALGEADLGKLMAAKQSMSLSTPYRRA